MESKQTEICQLESHKKLVETYDYTRREHVEVTHKSLAELKIPKTEI